MKGNSDLGQHMLISSEVIEEEVGVAELKKNDKVIEIGAGMGNLTERIVLKGCRLTSYEVDEKYKRNLKDLEGRYNNLKIVYGDALKSSWRGKNKIVSNIPYYLAELIIEKSIKEGVDFLVLITGEKFKDKLLSNSKIGIIARSYYCVDIIRRISPSCFEPKPKVNSALVKLSKKKRLNKIDGIILELVFYNGKIKNALLFSMMKLRFTKRMAKEKIIRMGFSKEILEKSASKMTSRFLLKIKEKLKGIL